MRLLRNAVLAGAGLGLLAVAGTAAAQEHARAMRTIQVPADALVLVLPGAHAVQPGVFQQAMPAGPFARQPAIDAMFQRMNSEMDAVMRMAESGFMSPGVMAPDRLVPAMTQDWTGSGARGVVVTSFFDGHRTCTQRVTYNGGGAPIVQTSGDACREIARAPVPTALPERTAPRERAHLVEAAAHPRNAARLFRVADLAR